MTAVSFPARTRAAMLARCFAVQGSFNYRTLIGAGFAFVMLPALRHAFRDRPAELDEAVRRHQEPFNSHPYLVGIAAGAVARLEAEGAPPNVLDRFKGGLRGSLGSLGDALFWAGLRPACMLLALATFALGAPAWAAALAFLLPYNAIHVAARAWGLQLGFRYGAGVASGLRSAPLGRAGLMAARSGAFLLGVLIPLVAAGALSGGVPLLAAPLVLVAAVLGLVVGPVVRGPVTIGLALLLVAGLLVWALS